MLMKDLVVFRDDLYFDGAVQADWFYQLERVDRVASSFVFHGPSTHAFARDEIAGRNLLDTASFTLRLAEKMADPEQGSPFTLAIAGYGTGKSHLAVALSALFSGEEWNIELHRRILENIRRVDSGIADQLEKRVKRPRLVLTLNGMRDFNLHYELLRCAERALGNNHLDHSLLIKLDRRGELAQGFISHSFDLLRDAFNREAEKRGLSSKDDELRAELLNELGDANSTAFAVIDQVYADFNGHPMRMDEGVSANAIIETLLREYCGLHGQFDGIVILFDEFGRFLEYAGANPAAAGDSALQQIFEAVQNAHGDVQFVGFIQSDIKAYLQRVDKTGNISRYIERYDASEKIFLSSNLETVFANLLEHPNHDEYQRYVSNRLRQGEASWRKLHDEMSAWLPLSGIWSRWDDFERIILNALYPLHPLSTYLLCRLTDWLQSRSSLTLLNEKLRRLNTVEIEEGEALPFIYPVDLIRGSFFSELLNAEEQGRQRSQFCILVNNIFMKFETKLSEDEMRILLSNLIVRICHFHFADRAQLVEALSICANLTEVQVHSALRMLEDEYAVLAFDERLICFDFVADSVGASDFRRYLNLLRNRSTFDPHTLALEAVQECADILEPIATNFAIERGIMTKEWVFAQRLMPIDDVNDSVFSVLVEQLKRSTEPDMGKGILLWVYAGKDTPRAQLDKLSQLVLAHAQSCALAVFLLDDARDQLRDAILSYTILRDMSEEDRAHYHRFYTDALEKAQERLRAEFADLKQERKRVLADAIMPIDARMGTHLTEFFAQIYPKVVPFDFDGFQRKSIAKARKQFCAMMKWILMEHLSYPALKSQTVEVRDRVQSCIAGNGIHSWRCLNEQYQAVQPMNGIVRPIYESLEKNLRDKGSLNLGAILQTLNAPPYGINDYAVFLLIGILCENLAYTTRINYMDQQQSAEKWAEIVVSDSKINLKELAKTQLIFIDTQEAEDHLRQLFRRINSTIDMNLVPEMAKQLDSEDMIPAEMQSDYALARMHLDEGLKALEEYRKNTAVLRQAYSDAVEKNDAYAAMQVAIKAKHIAESPASVNNSFRYNDEQLNWLATANQKACALAEKLFPIWIPTQRCIEVGRMNVYEKHIRKCVDFMLKLNFNQQAQELRSLCDKELDNMEVLRARQSLRENSENYLASCLVTRGLAMKALVKMAEQGDSLLNVYSGVSFEFIPQLKDLHERIEKRVQEIRDAYNQQKAELNSVWDRIYGMTDIQDMKLVSRQVHALLESGLTDQDRTDFEAISNFMDAFLADITAADRYSDDPQRFHNTISAMREKYSQGAEIDVNELLTTIEQTFDAEINRREKEWIEEHLDENVLKGDADVLDHWKKSTVELPKYLSPASIERVEIMRQKVELALSEKRLSYIEVMFRTLSPEEQNTCLERLRASLLIRQ